jgi:hypothetical protein
LPIMGKASAARHGQVAEAGPGHQRDGHETGRKKLRLIIRVP